MKKIKLLPIFMFIGALQLLQAQNYDAQGALSNVDRTFFIENKGQWPDEVLYLTRMGGLDAWITTNGVNYTFFKLEEVKDAKQEDEQHLPDKFEHKDYNIIGHRVLYELQGNNLDVTREGKQKQEGYYNYFIGNDPSKHASNVGLYKEAVVKNVYNGIDARYYFDKGSLRYDYIVHPGADPSQIAFTLKGSDKTYLDAKGNLVFTTRFGEVQMAELYCYQKNDKKVVNSQFVKKGDNWTIQLSNYDKTQDLIIDPLIYSTYIGGNNYDYAYSITTDNTGNAYITGYTSSPDYDIIPGAYQNNIGGSFDCLISKLNSSGSTLNYSTYFGGALSEIARDIKIDAYGNIYITGYTHSSNFVVTPLNNFQNTIGGGFDVFLSVFNSAGNSLFYSTYIGGSSHDYAYSLALETSSKVFLCGHTESSDFDITSGSLQTLNLGNNDGFVLKLNIGSSSLEYSTYLGGFGIDFCYAIEVDNSGNAYVTGKTSSSNFVTSAGAYQTTYGGGANDVFVTKLNSLGNSIVYSTYLGGSGDDIGMSIKIDVNNYAYITGKTSSTDFDTTANALQTIYGGGSSDAFVTKINTTGNGLVYSTYIGGLLDDVGNDINLDINKFPCIIGTTFSYNFPVTPGAYQYTKDSNYDVFVTKLIGGNLLEYSTFIGGSLDDYGYSLYYDINNNSVYLTGYTNSNNFDITPSAYQTSNDNVSDVFVSKLCLMAANLSSATGTDSQSVCINTPISQINYETTNATGIASVNGLPNGVNATWVNFPPFHPYVKISGTPTVAGTYNYSIVINGTCGSVEVNGTIIVNPINSFTLTSATGTDNQTVCVNSPITDITYAVNGATGYSSPSGLPNGLSVIFVEGILNISGTPTATGTFTYSIPLTGGCGNDTVTGTITVNPNNTATLVSGIGTDNQTVCVNTAITNITYNTTGATGIGTPSGLPSGVTANWASNVLTISGTPTNTGTFNYSIPLTGGCGNVSVTGTITVNSCTGIDENAKTIAWSVFPNPNHGVFTIRVEKPASFDLTDITGKILETYEVKTEQTIQLNFSAGVYFLREKSRGSVQKIVVK